MTKIILVFMLLITTMVASESKELIKVCYLEWGKLGGKKLPNKGFAPDVTLTVLKEAGYDATIDILPWSRCLKSVEVGRHDMVATFWIGEEQKKTYQYFEPQSLDYINFITLKDYKAKSGKLEDFYGKSIGVMRDAGGIENFFSQRDKFKVFDVNSEKQLINLLKIGRIDAIVTDSVPLLSLVDNQFPELVGKLKVWDPEIQLNISAPAVAHSHPKKDELMKRFNTAFVKLMKQDFYKELFQRHNLTVKYKKYN